MLQVVVCEGVNGNWRYDENNGLMKFTVKYPDENGSEVTSDYCVEMRGLGGVLILNFCNNEDRQRWKRDFRYFFIWIKSKPMMLVKLN